MKRKSRLVSGLRSIVHSWMSDRIDKALQVDSYFWLFILGVNNSGSTILSRVLGTHPKVRSLPAEGQLLTNAFPRPDHLGVVRIWTTRMDLFRWTEFDDRYPAVIARRDWAKYFPKCPGILLEKSPPNTIRARWLQQNFNPCRFIAIVRNPYAVCEGIRRRTGCSIEQTARHWLTANTCMFADMPFLNQCMWFKYEDFTVDPRRHLDEMQRFLGLAEPFSEDAIRSSSAHSLEGDTQGIRNLNFRGLANLSADDVEVISAVAGRFMPTLGYSPMVSAH